MICLSKIYAESYFALPYADCSVIKTNWAHPWSKCNSWTVTVFQAICKVVHGWHDLLVKTAALLHVLHTCVHGLSVSMGIMHTFEWGLGWKALNIFPAMPCYCCSHSTFNHGQDSVSLKIHIQNACQDIPRCKFARHLTNAFYNEKELPQSNAQSNMLQLYYHATLHYCLCDNSDKENLQVTWFVLL
jgi:hypothetical protein